MTAICFEHVSKRFTLHRTRSRSFQEVFVRSLRREHEPKHEPLWAVRDVSFAVEPGETVGIIGANGAGKSTVLKLISRIIEPTAGKIEVNGRVGALLELGTGFHPDLTGRENVYLNGSIVGLGRRLIDRVYDEIVEFSELERFIDVPVKHYSSGMFMRLAFSIAVYIDPAILLVDEVLAVGDEAFQRRCVDRLFALKRRKVSIVMVTHNLDAVRHMCDRAIWLDEGQVRAEGYPEHILEQYQAHIRAADGQALAREETQATGDSRRRWGSHEAEISRVELLDSAGQPTLAFRTGDPFTIRLHYRAPQRIERPQFGIALFHAAGFQINGPNTAFAGLPIEAIAGRGYVDYVIPSLPLLPGTYLVSASLYDTEGVVPYDYHHQAYTFRVEANSAVREQYGHFLIPATWRHQPHEACADV